MAVQIGIDLGTRAIKVVQGRMKGPLFEVQRAFMVPVAMEDEPEGAILAALDEVADILGKNVPGGRFSVSGRELIIRYTKVPPVPVWRLKLLMDFEVREMAEQAGESLASDYNLVHLPNDDGSEETVLVSVVKEAFLEARHQAISSGLGEPHSAQPSSLALFNAYLHSGELYEDETVMLVDVGDRNTEIVVQRDGELLFARNLAVGGRNLTDAVAGTLGTDAERAERVKEQHGNVTPKAQANYATGQEERVANALIGPAGQLSSMLQSALAFARAQTGDPGMQLGRILISGGGGALRGLPEYLSSAFNCPVSRFQPSSGLDLSGTDAEEAAAFDLDPGRFAVALGLAVSGAKSDAFLVDLVPDGVKKKRDFVQGKVWTIAAGVLALIVLALTAMNASEEYAALESEAKKLRREASRAKNLRTEVEDMAVAIREANTRVDSLDDLPRPAFALALAQELVQRHRPDGVWVRSVAIGRETLRRSGTTRTAKGAQKARWLVTVQGMIESKAQQPAEALNAMKTRMNEDRPDLQIRIARQESVTINSKDLTEFELEIDPFPRPEEPATEED